MTPEAIQAVERFVSAWADPFAAYQIAPRLNVNLVDALTNLLAQMGEPEIAEQWVTYQEQAEPQASGHR